MRLPSFHREDLTVAHHELAIDHDGLDVGRLTVVDPRGQDAPGGYEVGPLGVQDDEVCFLPHLERAKERFSTAPAPKID